MERDQVLDLFLEIPKNVVRVLARKRSRMALGSSSSESGSDEEGNGNGEEAPAAASTHRPHVERDRSAGATVVPGASAHSGGPETRIDIERGDADKRAPALHPIASFDDSDWAEGAAAKPGSGSQLALPPAAAAGRREAPGTHADGPVRRSRRPQQQRAAAVHPAAAPRARFESSRRAGGKEDPDVEHGEHGSDVEHGSVASVTIGSLLARGPSLWSIPVPRRRVVPAPERPEGHGHGHGRALSAAHGKGSQKLFRILTVQYVAASLVIASLFVATFAAGYILTSELDDHTLAVSEATRRRVDCIHATFLAREAVLPSMKAAHAAREAAAAAAAAAAEAGAELGGGHGVSEAPESWRIVIDGIDEYLKTDLEDIELANEDLRRSSTSTPQLAALNYG
eukprot:tig00000441_g700.t1